MAAALRYDWEAIRAEYEAGASQSALSQKYGVSRKAIQKRIAAEGWMQDVTGAVSRLAGAKVAGIVAGCDSQKRAEAIDAAAERTADVLRRHREEWDWHKKLLLEAAAEDGFGDKCKKAKIIAETLKIRQDGERKAWGISDVLETRSTVDATQTITIDGANMDRAGIEALVDQAYRLEAVK